MDASKILHLETTKPLDSIAHAVTGVLERGGLVVAPTETRYGLLVRHDSEEALRRLYEVKGRPVSMPTAFFVDSEERIRRYAVVTAAAQRLIQRFLPGPLTLVLKATVGWEPPRAVHGKIGFRWSASPLIEALVLQVPFMLTATSANMSGGRELETVDEIVEQLGGAVDLYVDGGRLNGPVSTVVDCSTGRPEVLRVGAIGSEVLFESIRDLIEYE